ncbi:RagB/SusD family nutrient uptake outer membrane protein [Hymenobacter seoulensis]
MKFSKYIRLVLAGSILLTAASCEKNLLDQVNPNVPTTVSFWKTSDDAVKGVNAAYSGLQQLGTYRRWLNFALDTRSDDSFSQSPWGELLDWNRFVQTNYDFEVSRDIWRDHYRAIFRTNQVIDNVPTITGMDATLQKRVLAEAKFLRALYYFNMVSLYGNVPLVLKASESLDSSAPQATEAQVWEQVIADLKAAQPDLPASYNGIDVGRATSGAATALLGKAYMQNRRWAEAQTEFTKIIGTTYSLTPNYTDNFRHTTENNAESIFEVQFNDDKLGGNDGDDATSSEGGQRSQFWGVPGAGFVDAEVRPWVVNEFLKEGTASGQRDPRLSATVFYNRRQFSSTLPVDADTIVYGRGFLNRFGNNERDRSRIYWRKYQNDYHRTFENFDSPINHRVIRYADILLLQAEALNEGGNVAGAVTEINKVRIRSGLAPLVAASFTQATLRMQIMHERVTELTGEGQRWFDLQRWGLLETQAGLDQLKARDEHFSNFVIAKSRLLPLPRTDVDLLRLNQNPGW